MKTHPVRSNSIAPAAAQGFRAALLTIMLSAALSAAELEVTVKKLNSRQGEIGIALFAGPEGFPLDNTHAVTVWLPVTDESCAYVFKDVAPGTYAVAVAHDLNGNHKTDTNWVGIPQEPWGVSNNVRPILRAPKFDEAAVRVAAGGLNRISINVSR
jgi:uncharacterized protein (DUF2141 family)